MKFRLRVMDADAQGQPNPTYHSQSSSSSSPYTYFTQQTQQANGVAAGFPTGNFSGGPEMFRGRFDMRDAIQWEFERERIRQEMIAEEMARKRILEEEVRRELMMERQMMAAGGFPPPFMPLPLPLSHNNLYEPGILHRQPIGLEERIIMSLEEKKAHGEIRGFEFGPRPLTEISQKEVIDLGKPNSETLSGVKRKPTPSITGESNASYSDTSKKRIIEEWSCAICQVTATSEHGLNEHLRGKKHRLKEAALIAQKTGANFGLGVAPKKPVVKPVNVAVTTVDLRSGDKKCKPRKRSGNRSPSIDRTLSANGSNDSEKEEVGIEAEKNKDKFKFWCEMCKVGAYSEKVMDNHREGKKHSVNLVELLQKGKPEIPGIVGKTGSEIKLVEEEEEGEVKEEVDASLSI